jgi:hypothetical protein
MSDKFYYHIKWNKIFLNMCVDLAKLFVIFMKPMKNRKATTLGQSVSAGQILRFHEMRYRKEVAKLEIRWI